MTDPRRQRRRAPIKRRIVELAGFALTEVTLVDATDDAEARTETIPCACTWAGENITTSTLFLGATTGRTDPDALGSTRPPMADRFTIDGHIEIVQFRPTDGVEAEEAAERALNALDGVLRACHRLNHPEVESVMDPAAYDAASCFISDVNLYHGFPDPQSASISGGVTFTIDVYCDI